MRRGYGLHIRYDLRLRSLQRGTGKMAGGELRQQLRSLPDQPDEDPFQRRERQDTTGPLAERKLARTAPHRSLSVGKSSAGRIHRIAKSAAELLRRRLHSLRTR